MKGRKAAVLSAVITGAVVAVSDRVGRGEITRSTAEKVTVVALTGAVRAVVDG